MDRVFEVVDLTGRRVQETLYKQENDAFAVIGRCVAMSPDIAKNYRVRAVKIQGRAR
jgi:hypothetical protein